MASQDERNRNDERGDEDATGSKGESISSEAIPDADRDTAYDSSTSGGAGGEVQDPSDTPPPSQRGRDLDH